MKNKEKIWNSSLHKLRSEHFTLLRKRSVNYVNLVNLFYPCCICFVNLAVFAKQIAQPLMKFTKFTIYTGRKMAIFTQFLADSLKKDRFLTRFSLKTSSIYEYMLTIRWYKVSFIEGIKNRCVNLVNLPIFEVHRSGGVYL